MSKEPKKQPTDEPNDDVPFVNPDGTVNFVEEDFDDDEADDE